MKTTTTRSENPSVEALMKSVTSKAELLHLRIIQTLINKGIISQQEARLFDVPMVHICQNVALVRALDEEDTLPLLRVTA
jgi:hypothetical protein